MVPLPEWKPRRTLIDLYMERDQIQWYWRLAGTCSAASIMIGYVLEGIETAVSQADTFQILNLSCFVSQQSARMVESEKF